MVKTNRELRRKRSHNKNRLYGGMTNDDAQMWSAGQHPNQLLRRRVAEEEEARSTGSDASREGKSRGDPSQIEADALLARSLQQEGHDSDSDSDDILDLFSDTDDEDEGDDGGTGDGGGTVMPDGWAAYKDPQGNPYYHHAQTGVTEWTLPGSTDGGGAGASDDSINWEFSDSDDDDGGSGDSDDDDADGIVMPNGWMQFKDDKGTPYYYHEETEERSWVLPDFDVGGGGGGGATMPVASPEMALPFRETETEAGEEAQVRRALTTGWNATAEPQGQHDQFLGTSLEDTRDEGAELQRTSGRQRKSGRQQTSGRPREDDAELQQALAMSLREGDTHDGSGLHGQSSGDPREEDAEMQRALLMSLGEDDTLRGSGLHGQRPTTYTYGPEATSEPEPVPTVFEPEPDPDQ